MMKNKPHLFSNLLGKIYRKTNNIIYRRHISIWYQKRLNDLVPNDKMPSELSLSIHFDQLDDIITWLEANRSGYPWIYSLKEVEAMRCYEHMVPFVEYDGEIIGYTKVALNGIYIKDYDSHFGLAPNKAMFYDTTVVKAFRGRKVPHMLKLRIFERLMEKGIEQVFAHIESWNIPSIKSNQRLGFSEIGTNRYLRVMGFHHHSLDIEGLLG